MTRVAVSGDHATTRRLCAYDKQSVRIPAVGDSAASAAAVAA